MPRHVSAAACALVGTRRASPQQGGGGQGGGADHRTPLEISSCVCGPDWDRTHGRDRKVVTTTVLPMTDPLAWLTDLEGVRSAYAGTRDGIDVMLRDRGLRRTSPEMTGRVAAARRPRQRRARGLGLDAGGGARGRGRRDRRRRRAALRLDAGAGAAAQDRAAAGDRAAARRGRRRGSLPDDELGRPRDAASADRLRGVAELLLSGTEAPALLVAAVAHADVATAAPFASHNGIVARAPRAAGAGLARRRREVARGARGRAPGAAGGVRVEPARLRRAAARRACTPGCSTAPRRSPRAPRPRRCAAEPARGGHASGTRSRGPGAAADT